MKKLLSLSVLILVAFPGKAQAPTRQFPDVVTSQTNASIALTGYKSTVEGYLVQDGTDIQNLQQTIAAPTTGLLDRVAKLEAQMAAIQNPAPQPTLTTVNADLTALPAGPLSGNVGVTIPNAVSWSIGWGTGLWNASSSGVVAACATSAGVTCPAHTFVLPTNQTLLSVTFVCSQNCSLWFSDSAGETTPQTSVLAGATTTLNMNWTKVSNGVSLKMASGPATAVTITALSWN